MPPLLSPLRSHSCAVGSDHKWASAGLIVSRQLPLLVSAAFSTTTPHEFRTAYRRTRITKQRRALFGWLKRNGERFEFPVKPVKKEAKKEADDKKDKNRKKKKKEIQTRYVTGHERQPFPMNRLFFSEPVLDDASRNLIYRKVMQEGRSVKAVSATHGVDIRRVVAVVRLKEVEKQWNQAGKPLAKEYAEAMFSMLPLSHLEGARKPHESIHDVHAHRYSLQQLFLPVSESKHFTREDAAKAFHRNLLPADKRIPIPELIQFEKDKLEGKPLKERMQRLVSDTSDMEQKLAERIRTRAEREARRVTKVESNRFQFRFQNFEVEDVGTAGRSKKGTGWRYGVPLYDRQRGHSREVPEKVGI